ncbi:hypothetical protein Sa4125_09510 [Aureimonas sp. SA4125]|uniref:hypothetical protein n=1 Tax=Aureimonas sp. SA4125 TaxID=2826993 RepID=UPI001CC3DFCD|nr:hypothetical protein [Aureimonas sp. SA4125]BDA83409.1 hypothetical protein Sa4125_09510 [Aureimonas sp. SA4125]
MKITMLAFAVMASSAAYGPAMAQSLMPSTSTGRYEMQPIEGGVARLDTQTGEVSLCQVEAGTMRCQPSEEDRARLEARIRELSDGRADPERQAATAPPPSAEEDVEVDKAINQMKKFFRAFRDITREFDETPPGPAPSPDRT